MSSSENSNILSPKNAASTSHSPAPPAPADNGSNERLIKRIKGSGTRSRKTRFSDENTPSYISRDDNTSSFAPNIDLGGAPAFNKPHNKLVPIIHPAQDNNLLSILKRKRGDIEEEDASGASNTFASSEHGAASRKKTRQCQPNNAEIPAESSHSTMTIQNDQPPVHSETREFSPSLISFDFSNIDWNQIHIDEAILAECMPWVQEQDETETEDSSAKVLMSEGDLPSPTLRSTSGSEKKDDCREISFKGEETKRHDRITTTLHSESTAHDIRKSSEDSAGKHEGALEIAPAEYSEEQRAARNATRTLPVTRSTARNVMRASGLLKKRAIILNMPEEAEPVASTSAKTESQVNTPTIAASAEASNPTTVDEAAILQKLSEGDSDGARALLMTAYPPPTPVSGEDNIKAECEKRGVRARPSQKHGSARLFCQIACWVRSNGSFEYRDAPCNQPCIDYKQSSYPRHVRERHLPVLREKRGVLRDDEGNKQTKSKTKKATKKRSVSRK